MTRKVPRSASTISILLVALAGCGSLEGERAREVGAPPAAAALNPPQTYVQLFRWRWTDVAKECTDFLGPRGFGAVQISPPQAHKNVGLLLRAFADPALRDLRLVLFGGEGRGAFEARGSAVPDNVVFAGRVSDGELRALYAHALCVAFPSTTEGFGLPPLEAMLVGCPAVVAPCGALPEVCGSAAVQAASPESMTLLTVTAGRGHGIGSSLSDDLAYATNIYSFLFDRLGVEYKTKSK